MADLGRTLSSRRAAWRSGASLLALLMLGPGRYSEVGSARATLTACKWGDGVFADRLFNGAARQREAVGILGFSLNPFYQLKDAVSIQSSLSNPRSSASLAWRTDLRLCVLSGPSLA